MGYKVKHYPKKYKGSCEVSSCRVFLLLFFVFVFVFLGKPHLKAVNAFGIWAVLQLLWNMEQEVSSLGPLSHLESQVVVTVLVNIKDSQLQLVKLGEAEM